MLMDKYLEVLNKLIKKVTETQRGNIEKAAEIIAESVKKGGVVHIYDTGHLINSELINRAGGLALFRPFRYTFNVDNPVGAFRSAKSPLFFQEGMGKYLLGASNVMPGDVLIAGSVSGKSANVVDIALAAREMGVKVITITSIAYSSSLESLHSSGKRLFEVGDVVIDNCAPIGDAMLQVDGLDVKALPASGISAAVIMWSMAAELIEKLMTAGLTPTVFKSVNFPGGPENHQRLVKQYEEKGY